MTLHPIAAALIAAVLIILVAALARSAYVTEQRYLREMSDEDLDFAINSADGWFDPVAPYIDEQTRRLNLAQEQK